jgi:hypothetical protein
MDKNAIKKYAVWARRELISRVSQKAMQYAITDNGYDDKDADSVNGSLLSPTEKSQRKALIAKICSYDNYKNGYEQVVEEVAYTWFNRFTALRFMEVNGYLPTHIRVFTDDSNSFKPQILTEALHVDMAGLNKDTVYKLKQANKDDELFKYLIITQCNALGDVLPGMFHKISDYTELLFPDNLLREGSVIDRMIAEIPEEDWDVGEQGQVEIIGWLYQYYISEKHDAVVDPLHGKVVKKEDVPAATQLFTTDWVVRYITDNSLGRYWIERHPESTLADGLQYFIKPNDGITYIKENIEPKELTVLDPCVGSGHFLVYAFDVLMKIYTECGYSTREAVSNIVENNLYGLDIDERATQLAYFAVMMKACSYDGRFLSRHIQPNIYAIEESNGIENDVLNYFAGNDENLKKDIVSVMNDMRDAKEYGSIITINPVDFDALFNRFDAIYDDSDYHSYAAWNKLLPVVRIAYILAKKYKTVITNPPYLNKFSPKLKSFIEANYKDYSGDLFSVFIYRNFDLCEKDGYSGFMTPFVWMFIKTYEKLRTYIIENKSITSLIQMEYSAYDEATVPICTFILKNGKEATKGLYFRLSKFVGGMEVQRQKVLEAIADRNCGYYYETYDTNFTKIPGSPIAYWAGKNVVLGYKNPNMDTIAQPRHGLATSDNARFLRLWFEVANIDESLSEIPEYTKKWFPMNKGGEFRRWYGNNDWVINYADDGKELKDFAISIYRCSTRTIQNTQYYFKKGLTWSALTSGNFSVRYTGGGALFGSGGYCAFANDDILKYILALLNNKVTLSFLSLVSPTLNFEVGHIKTIPVVLDEQLHKIVDNLVDENIALSKADWDSFETSWDFKKHPLI